MRTIRKSIAFIFCLLLCSCSSNVDTMAEATYIAPTVLLAHRDVSSITMEKGISVERISEETITADQKTVYRTPETISKNELYWLAAEVDAGTPEKEVKYYDVTYSSTGEVLSKTYVLGGDQTVAATPRVLEFGAEMAEDTYFNPKFSRYGLDCVGCSGQYTKTGGNALGIRLDGTKGIQQADGSWKQGITWEGYYIVASDPSIPLCSILEISNHNYSGEGLNPDEPFYAIVMDRGGAIKNNRLDFYIGLEGNLNKNVKVVSQRTPVARIVRVGGVIRKNGARTCKL